MIAMEDFEGRLNSIKCCVIIPTYNNGNTLEGVVSGVAEYTNNIIVVNDGSDDNTTEILKQFTNFEIIHHVKNKGKGSALKIAFKKAIEKGYSYAITIDSDGQHNPDEIPLFIDAAEKQPGSLIVGIRNFKQENMPQKSGFANKFSNFCFRFIAGVKLSDTQSGYRLYPLNCISRMKLITGKYEFELEVLVRAAWKKYKIISVPINTYYLPSDKRVTHFRPFRDFTRISLLNTVLFFIAVFYVKPYMFFKSYDKR